MTLQRSILSVFISVILLNGAFSQTTGKIAGSVTEQATGQPMPGANVLIEGTAMGAVTDESGRFFIINIAPGQYRASARMIGYGTVTMSNVRVSVNTTTTLDFRLQTQAIEGEAVLVTADAMATKKDQTSSVRTMSTEELKLLPIENVNQAVNLQAGVVQGHFRGGVLVVYFGFVLGIGWFLRKNVTSSSDFLTSGHSLPLWITSLAFLAANMGALEMIGMCGSGAKYGMMTSHFYWMGAIPAMLFVGVFMMPFYYGSKARSVPEYLKLRFDEKTRGFNAITFAVMTLFASGISMYALGILLQEIFGWSFTFSVLASAGIVLVYTYLGGLSSAIYNEVLQFFLIVAGFSPLAIMAVNKAGGWDGISAKLEPVMTSSWKHVGSAADNPMGVEIFGLFMGLGFVLSFGYWCTNYLVVQRAMAARSMTDARNTPVVGAIPKMFIPFIVIVPGIAAVAIAGMGVGYDLPTKPGGGADYDRVLFSLMQQFYPSGMLGVGLTALVASFMSGMAGNVTAFNTVWTYDIYQSYIRKNAPDSHYLWMGRMATIFGCALSIGAAYMARSFNNMMDFLQLIFGFVNAPLFATFLLGMFWTRTTGHAAFTGLVSGTAAAAATYGFTLAEGKGGWLGNLHEFPSSMAQNFWVAINAWVVCFVVTILVSMVTKPKPQAELVGLVYGVTPHQAEEAIWWQRPGTIAAIVAVICLGLNFVFF